MLLVLVDRLRVSLGRVVRNGGLSLRRPVLARLQLQIDVIARRVGWRVDLINVLLEALLTLEARNVASRILVFDDAVLGDGSLVHLPTVLPLLFLMSRAHVNKHT